MSSDLRPVSENNASVWPRRASRACASCRRDKTRCDGARPCGGCTKKGYADQCVDGCDPCRRARVRCEDGKPCQRCREMQIECTEEVTSLANRQEQQTPIVRPSRTNVTERAKLACTNCRRDNKKCDDQRPCGRCVTRGEDCVHVGRSPKLVKLRCEGCRQDGKRCEDARPCSSCVEGNRECVTQPRKGRGHGTRVKAACVTCRRDKIRCDGIRPCASCVRKGIECLDRACKACAREGLSAECTHRKLRVVEGGEGSIKSDQDNGHEPYPGGPQGPLHLPPISQVALPPPHQLYDPAQGMSAGPSHFYYPTNIMGPGQPPPPMMPPYLHPSQRHAYYPVIDPNIDGPPPTVPIAPSASRNESIGQSA